MAKKMKDAKTISNPTQKLSSNVQTNTSNAGRVIKDILPMGRSLNTAPAGPSGAFNGMGRMKALAPKMLAKAPMQAIKGLTNRGPLKQSVKQSISKLKGRSLKRKFI
jgi:hypothetical protein